MAWHQWGDKPWSDEPMLVNLLMQIYASLGPNELSSVGYDTLSIGHINLQLILIVSNSHFYEKKSDEMICKSVTLIHWEYMVMTSL